jgi:RND family efflux transporter MFP subunit
MNNANSVNRDEKKGLGKISTVIICLLVIAIAVAGAIHLKNSKRKPKKRKSVEKATYVETLTAQLSNHSLTIRSSGIVVPARELRVKSRVSGEVVIIHPDLIEGGIIEKGTEIVCIDPDDYKLAIIQAQREVVQAKYALQLEQGHQDIARQEWSMMQPKKGKHSQADQSLILRKPHLAKAKADLAAAEATLKKATLMLERTRIVAPFNAFVRNKNIELGSQISTQDVLVELVGIDSYWIRVSLPLDRLQYLDIFDDHINKAVQAEITYRNQYSVHGTVLKCLGELEQKGHMAQLIVRVDQPTKLSPPLLIGEYVSICLIGKELQKSCRIPRTALRNNEWVWLASPDNTLNIKKVRIGFRDTKDVLITHGIAPNDQIIVSEIGAPVQGAKVSIFSKNSQEKSHE